MKGIRTHHAQRYIFEVFNLVCLSLEVVLQVGLQLALSLDGCIMELQFFLTSELIMIRSFIDLCSTLVVIVMQKE